MNINNTNDKQVANIFIKLIIVVVILSLLTFGLAEYTIYLADICSTTPDKSLKEFLYGFSSLLVGIITIASGATTIGTFSFLLLGFISPDIFKD